ncbi:SDR family NAD(P)-dependent oxidoreductase [Amycolatopsis aidingensis]|uniref:SDR family NAD(P)-dependent oxidoreductase n=1 Tax=Amycolatopsis aidingensis TaxID=2842453 RepID=UPI001C0C6329|nr:glucose 1-dehydrogenase [Amycolatopsis aidingensis]
MTSTSERGDRRPAGQFSLDGKGSLVTGASRGIGRAIAIGYAQAGADVALLARSTTALEEVADEIEGYGRRALVLTCDVGDGGQVDDAIATAISEFGQLDVVVNNAGGFDWAGPVLDLEQQDWSAVLRINLESVVRVCRAVGRHLVKRGSGSVVNLSSIAGLGGVPMLAPYAVAKAGILSLTQTLAAEWAQSGVRVNALTPGWVRTELTEAFLGNPEAAAGLLSAVPASRFGEPDDVVGPAIFLASDASRLVTGACLTADGGTTCYVGGPAMLQLTALGRVAV